MSETIPTFEATESGAAASIQEQEQPLIVVEQAAEPVRQVKRLSGYMRRKAKIERLTTENEQLRQQVAVLQGALREIDRRLKNQRKPLTPDFTRNASYEFNARS